MAWQSGQSLYGDRYTILKRLGEGGFGITYLAQDQQGQQVVIKTLKDEVMTDPDYADYRDKYLRDFKNEALSLAVCRHPNIVQIENVFHHQGLPCIVMEYVAGLDLGQRLRQQGPLSEAEAVRYVQQVGAGLKVVHHKGRLHRDLKPQNIMVREANNEAVLIDFGIAREFLPDVTQTHTCSFTHGFAPIEQYDTHERRGEFTDVYALAATLSALITGETPPPSTFRLKRDRFRIPKSCNARVRDAIGQGMEVMPEERPQTVEDWLQLLLETAPTVRVSPQAPTHPPKPDPKLPKTIRVSPEPPTHPPERDPRLPDTIKVSPIPPEPKRKIPVQKLGQLFKVKKSQAPQLVQISQHSEPKAKQPPEPKPTPKLQVPVRYQKLAKLLKAGDWKGADRETGKQMLAVANRTKEGYLDFKSIDNFPCEDLRAIDQLWVHYSGGRFGFSVQKRIYQSLGGMREYDAAVWRAFGDQVGWRKNGRWVYYEELSFNISAKGGHLPVAGSLGLGWWDREQVILLSRPDF